jgi:ABC-type nitrate/sulfonate/bicarbonate transport system substrate-binding protein
LHDGVFIWGIIGQIFERTNILEINGLKGDIQALKDSTATTAYFLKNKTDISLNSTGGISYLIAISNARPGIPQPKLIAILGAGGRNALIVPYDSPIRELQDLKGKRILNPIIGALLDRFIEPGGLTRNDIIMTEKYDYGMNVIDEFKSGTFDAAMSWDPFVQEHVEKKEARILAHDPYHLEIIVRKELIDENPEAAVNFLVAFKEAVFFMQTHLDTSCQWYSEVSGIDAELIKRCMAYADIYNETKDVKSPSDISLLPAENKITDMQDVADAMQWSGTFKSKGLPDDKISIKGAIDYEIIRKAEAKLKQRGKYHPARIKAIK